jgi:hypothetical protein
MKKTLLPTVLLAALLAPVPALAQSSCASDGQPRPVALLERFINADCASCWSDPQAPAAQRGEVALDWIVPGSRGDDAPLSAVATRDSLKRLLALGRDAPPQTTITAHHALAGLARCAWPTVMPLTATWAHRSS